MATKLQTLVQTDEPPVVFVSYSHNERDNAWKNQLLTHLEQLEPLGILSVWSDRDIKPGIAWYDKIYDVLSKTRVAVCLISADFLNSAFCMNEEIPYLLQRRDRGDLEIFPVLLRDCLWDEHHWLRRLQMLPDGAKPLQTHFNNDPDLALADVARHVRDFLTTGEGWERPKPKGSAPKVDITRLPESDDILFGRRDELNFLDETWNGNNLNVAVFKASGGVGKSSLVRCWVEDMVLDNYRGARRVYAWSFYSQGTNERATSADLFLAEALDWFGDETRGRGLSSSEMGLRLAALIRRERTILLLDGLEPLQSSQSIDRGKIKDQGLKELLIELTNSNPGLCLITTRVEITDLWDDKDNDSAKQYDLDTISTTAGRALLRVRGIQGEDDELEQAVKDFGQHAYAVKLLGSFLAYDSKPYIKHAVEILDLPNVEDKDGKHSRRVMAAFADRFGQGPKANILAMLGLFDRPADESSLSALRAAPSVKGLNDAVLSMENSEWNVQIAELRHLSLLTPISHHEPDELDAHPLVREHFGARLRQQHPDAWKAGHRRLYERLKSLPSEHQPATLADMTPLFLAIQHGCMAGCHREAFLDVYKPRICRNDSYYITKKLGAFGTDLDVIASFFDQPWETPAADLEQEHQSLLLKIAAFNFRAVGRPDYSLQLMQSGLERDEQQQHWDDATTSASNLSELHLVLGSVGDAIRCAKSSVNHADQAGDDEWQRISRTTLADAYHQQGSFGQALSLFVDAEARLKSNRPNLPILLSLRGYRYCDLLLTLGRSSEAFERATYALKAAQDHQHDALSIALDKLSIGRAALALGHDEKAGELLNEVVCSLREANTRHYVPNGLLARAAFYRKTEDYEKSRKDLVSAMHIAERGKMRLHQCDAHLGFIRLALIENDRDSAREHLTSAAALVRKCEYGRRKNEIEELEAALA